MLSWRRKGPAFTAPVKLDDGRSGSVVVLGAGDNPKGMALVVQAGGEQQSINFPEAAEHLTPETLIEAYAVQERGFGGHGLPKMMDS